MSRKIAAKTVVKGKSGGKQIDHCASDLRQSQGRVLSLKARTGVLLPLRSDTMSEENGPDPVKDVVANIFLLLAARRKPSGVLVSQSNTPDGLRRAAIKAAIRGVQP